MPTHPGPGRGNLKRCRIVRPARVVYIVYPALYQPERRYRTGGWAGWLAGWLADTERQRHTPFPGEACKSPFPSLSLSPFHIMRAIKEGDRGACASRDKGLHSSPPVPSASPPRLQGTTDMGLLGISSFRDMPASLFVSSSLALGRCSGLVCLPPAPPATHTHSQDRPTH